MTRHKIDPLRALTDEERGVLTQISRSASEPASHVARAKALLAVADVLNYQEAAHAAGRRAGDAVAQLVSRFNREGLAAIAPRHGGGAQPVYGSAERERILQEVRRTPDREQDGTATWSLTTLQRALRQAPDGLLQVSTYTILMVLPEVGFTWQTSQGLLDYHKYRAQQERDRNKRVIPAQTKRSHNGSCFRPRFTWGLEISAPLRHRWRKRRQGKSERNPWPPHKRRASRLFSELDHRRRKFRYQSCAAGDENRCTSSVATIWSLATDHSGGFAPI